MKAWPFFLLAVGGTWLFWLVPLLAGWPIWEAPAIWFLYAGGACVPAAALFLGWRHGQLADLLRRLVDPRLVGARWWLLILLLVPAAHLVAGVLAAAGGYQPTPLLASSAMAMPMLDLLRFAGFILLLGPLPEEIGWRGYGLPALLNRFDARDATLLLGLAWCAWHVPLFFMRGYYDPFGGPPDPILFFGGIIVISVFYTWIFLNTGGSIMAAVLFHFSVNFTGEILVLSPAGEAIRTALLGGGALLLVIGTLRGRVSSWRMNSRSELIGRTIR